MSKEVSFKVNGEEVKLTGNTVKNYLTRGNDSVTDQEVVMFINLCRYQKLNPFLNEAYLVKFKGAPAQIITSKEAYMKKAEMNPQYDGMRAGLIVQRENNIIEVEGSFTLKGDTLLGAWAEVYRKDRKYPYVAKVSFDEYNKGQSTWKQMPKTMIRKVAIVQALREAFPVDLGALYVEEEAQAVSDVEHEVKEEIQNKANSKTINFPKDNVKDVDYREVNDTKPETTTTKDKRAAEQMSIEGPGF
jgi:phage recombination protein Bet